MPAGPITLGVPHARSRRGLARSGDSVRMRGAISERTVRRRLLTLVLGSRISEDSAVFELGERGRRLPAQVCRELNQTRRF